MWTLIVADDDAGLCRTLAAAAREATHAFRTVKETNSYDAAFAAIDEHARAGGKALLVLSDLDLRHTTRTGIDVLLHALERQPDSLRILMSGQDPAELLRDGRGLAVDAFLEKPFLFEAVEKLASGRIPTA